MEKTVKIFRQYWEKYVLVTAKIWVVLLVIFLALVGENVILVTNAARKTNPILGLRVYGKGVSGLNKTQLEALVLAESKKVLNQSLVLVYQGKRFEIRPVDIGVSVDEKSLVDQAVGVGKRAGVLENLVNQNKALVGLENIRPKAKISQTLLNLKILEIQGEVNEEAKPLRPDFVGDINRTLPAQDGVKVNTDKLTMLIADNIDNPPPSSIAVPTIKTFTAEHKEEELRPIRERAVRYTRSAISISSGDQVFTLSPAEIKDLLEVVERPDPKDPRKLVLQLRLNDVLLNRKLGEFAKKVEDVSHAEFDDHDARVAIYSQLFSTSRRIVAIPTGQGLAGTKVLGATTGPKIAYLTFDDGPNSIYHPMILDILKQNNIKATFFLVGQNAVRDNEITKRTLAEGHRLGNHSYTHPFLPGLSKDGIAKELASTNNVLVPINHGQAIDIFRPPYGGVNLLVRNEAADLKMKLFLWDVDPRDWSEPGTDELVRRVTSAIFPGADVLMHSNHLATVKALPKIIENLRSQGYSFEQLH